MTLKLELNPELEANLLAQAQASGLSLEAYLDQVLRSAAVFPTRSKHTENLFVEQRPDGDDVVRSPHGRKSLAQLFAESPFRGLGLRFERDGDTGRPFKL